MEFERFLASSYSIDEALRKYSDFLKAEYEADNQKMKMREKASAIQAFRNVIGNEKLINELYDIFEGLSLHISNKLPKLSFSLTANIKSAQSFIEKIDMFQAQGKPLDSVTKDIIRFRITTAGPEVDTIESINLLEQTMLLTVNFFLIHNFMLSNPGKTKDLLPEKDYKKFLENNPDIFIMDSKHTLIPKGYCSYFKNYIVTPKKNGYQRLHAVVTSADDGVRLEFQGETFAMHKRANGGLSDHAEYKKNRQKLVWDPASYANIGEVGLITPKMLFSKEL